MRACVEELERLLHAVRDVAGSSDADRRNTGEDTIHA
jgi:hypothetical protein